jgi:phytanoyl-CoA hydroxylase
MSSRSCEIVNSLTAETQHRAGRGFSADELERFQRDGFVIVRGLAEAELLERMRDVTVSDLANHVGSLEYEADLDYPGSPADRAAEGGDTIRRLRQALSRDVVFTEWASDPELLVRLRQLLGPQVVMPLAHHNCVMTKHPHYSSETGWHQDIRYWCFERPELVSVWLALGPERQENGALQVIPGTHRMEFDGRRLDGELFLREDLAENRALIERQVQVELDAGDVLFFHCRTFHAAGVNQSDAAKFSVVTTFRSGDNPPVPGTRSSSLPELLLPPAGA